MVETSEVAFVSKIVTKPEASQDVKKENVHVKRNTNLPEVLHP